MNMWSEEIKLYLETKNYEKVVSYYEKRLEDNPDEINDYWYLGLSYLLAGHEVNAQTTWFILFSDADDQQTQQWIKDLSEILHEEAHRLENEKDYERAWLVRSNLQEVNPSFLENLLHLLNISIITKKFEPELITDWGILALFNEQNNEVIEINLLLKVLDNILRIPLKESIELAEKCLIFSNKNVLIEEKILELALFMGFDYYYPDFAIELLWLHVKFFPNCLKSYRDLHTFYRLLQNEIKAIEIGKIIEEKSQSTEDKLLGNYCQLISACLSSQWDLTTKLKDKQIEYWEEIINQKTISQNSLVKDCFVSGLMCLLYLEDDLIKHRYLYNKVSGFFQNFNNIQKQVSFNHDKTIRKLKIGYIGSTFKTHSVSFLCRWLINHHNPDLFDIYIYSVQVRKDNMTEQWFMPPKVKQFYDGSRDLLSIIKQIESDQIDILIDLDSLTCNLTAMIMSQKIAPIQVTWLGLDASGLPTIDYYIADPYVLPVDAEKYYLEKIWRLPNTYLGIDGFEIGIPSLKREDLNIKQNDIIFMNLQNSVKLNPSIICLQLEIIKKIPNSYLLTKTSKKEDDLLKKLIIDLAESKNIDKEKLKFILWDDRPENHRANIKIADIVLDTYPYNGATTTLEALWQEIPVITRVGEQFAARNSYTFMMNAGITEGIAWSDEEYIEWGIKLGTDENLRKEVSWKLKQSKKTSPLWNGKQFTREMEKAYQQMWEIYVNQQTKIGS